MKKRVIFILSSIFMVGVLTVGLTSCNDDDSGLGGSALVGTWTKQIGYWGVIGFKITSDAKFYYNEWDSGEEEDFSNVIYPYNISVSSTSFRITHDMEPGYYEEYEYEISEDGNSIELWLLGFGGDIGYHNLGGTYKRTK